MHSRRARPTLRLLREDLGADWGPPHPKRLLADGDLTALHPLSGLPHPIIEKAAESVGPDPDQDNFVGPIHSSTRLPLLEVKQGQWRGGIWRDDESGVHWLVVAGLAKGNHLDRDDFYERIDRENKSGQTARWLPTDQDVRLLRQETAARIRTSWELGIQQRCGQALRAAADGVAQRFEIVHPVASQGVMAQVEISITEVRDDEIPSDEVVVDVRPRSELAGSNLHWGLIIRLLRSIDPPEQSWDRYQDTFSTIGEPGAWKLRAAELARLTRTGELAQSTPGKESHYAHRKDLTECTLSGRAVRSLCGIYFVPTQDHQGLPECLHCQERLAELPE